MLQVKTPRVTIPDDAALSICTVSRALRNLPNGSAHTAKAAEEMSAASGYGTVLISQRPSVHLLIDRLHRSGLPNPPSSHVREVKVIARRSSRHRRRPTLSPAA